MPVGRPSGAQADAVEEWAVHGDLTAKIGAGLLHGKRHILMGMPVIMVMILLIAMVMVMVMRFGHVDTRWYAVAVFAVRDREAQIASVADIGDAACDLPGFCRCIGQLAAQSAVFPDFLIIGLGSDRAQRSCEDIASRPQIAGLGVAAIGMCDEASADRHLDLASDGALIGCAAIGGDGVHMHRLIGHAAGDAAVDHIDDAADCGGAVEQGGGTAQDLDPISGQRVYRDRVVDRGV